MENIDLCYLVDDDAISTLFLKKHINDTQFCNQLQSFTNGQETIDQILTCIVKKKTLPDVILLDLNMPIMDGWDFLNEFIRLPIDKKIAIFIVTSSIDKIDIEKAKNYNVVKKVISKPINKEILSKIKSCFC